MMRLRSAGQRRGGRAALATMTVAVLFACVCASASAAFGVEAFEVSTSVQGVSTRQAGAHPDLRTVIKFSRRDKSHLDGNARDIEVDLPPGFVGNAANFPVCSLAALGTDEETGRSRCPITTIVGYAEVEISFSSPIYNLQHGSSSPALFGFVALNLPVFLEPVVRPGDYGISTLSARTSVAEPVFGAEVTFWGVPADPSHDFLRGGPSPLAPVPFLSNPTSCSGSPLTFTGSANSWQEPGRYSSVSTSVDSEGTPFTLNGCERLGFAPSAEVRSTSRAAHSSSGLDVDIKVPQNESPNGLATADVKKTVVTLPEGFSINAAAAVGQGGCSEAQIGIGSNDPPTCPAASKIGSVKIDTPLLEEELEGSVILARQNENPFGSLVALYLAVKGPGFYLKLPGKVELDPSTGRVVTTFDNTPQLPFEELNLSLTGNLNTPLITPSTCGTFQAKVEMTSWASAKPVALESPVKITEGCSGGGFSPSLKAGTKNPSAGSFSPFTLQVTRQDGESNLSRIQATLPPGLLAKLAGVPLCGDAQAASGDCPAASQVGTTTIGAGAGPNPVFVPEAGKAPTAVYLGGPYRGAPYSLVVKVPAQAGPFDLGTVVVRNALRIDPTTTQVTAESDPLPQILEGIPIGYRDVRIEINRPDFTVNPTKCSQFQVTSLLVSSSSQTASPKAPFAAANCERLAFKPTLALQMKGQTKRAGDPALTAVLKAPKGQANIASTTVILPKTAFIDQRHVSNPCTRVQFAADACPAKSVLGTAVAYSPLLGKPLEGPVYFRSNGGDRQLPDIVADLHGQIHVVLVGFIDSKKVSRETSLVRTRFASVPDAPVSKFVLRLKGGKQSLIQNSANLCKAQPRAEVKMTGQNGKTHDFEQKIAVSCGKKGKRKS